MSAEAQTSVGSNTGDNAVLNGVDSLSSIGERENDSLIIEGHIRLAKTYIPESKDSALRQIDMALEKAKELKINDLIAVSYYYTGQVYEHYKNMSRAEEAYNKWLAIRKEQGDSKYRWALKGMRRFYSESGDLEKLKAIDDAWVELCDREYKNNVVVPAFVNSWVDAELAYKQSMENVVENLLRIGDYAQAEKYFRHSVDVVGEPVSKWFWLSGNSVYFRVQNALVSDRDTEVLKSWYTTWFNAINKYSDDASVPVTVLNLITQEMYSTAPEFGMQMMKHLVPHAYDFKEDAITIEILKMWTRTFNSYLDNNSSPSKYGEKYQNEAYRLALEVNYRYWDAATRLDEDKDVSNQIKHIDAALNKYKVLDDDVNSKMVEVLRGIKTTTSNKALRKSLKKTLKKL